MKIFARSIMLMLALLPFFIPVQAASGTSAEQRDFMVKSIGDLKDPAQTVRDTAARTIREILKINPDVAGDPGESYWKEKFKAIKLGMELSEIIRVVGLNSDQTAEGILCSGQSCTYIIRLDDYWTVTLFISSQGDGLLGIGEFKRKVRSVNVSAPKDFSGKWVTYFVNGQVAYESQQSKGVSILFRSFYDNGQLVYEQSAKKNRPETGYYPNGAIMYEGQYVSSKMEGIWTHWYPNGHKKSEIHYRNGQSVAMTLWSENGQKTLENNETGETTWNEDGTLQYTHAGPAGVAKQGDWAPGAARITKEAIPVNSALLTKLADCVYKIKVGDSKFTGKTREYDVLASSDISGNGSESETTNVIKHAQVISVIKGSNLSEIQIEAYIPPLRGGKQALPSYAGLQLAKDDICLVFLKRTEHGYRFYDPHNSSMEIAPGKISYQYKATPQQRLLQELLASAKSKDPVIRRSAISQIGNWSILAREEAIHGEYSTKENAYEEATALRLLRKLRKSDDILTRALALIVSIQIGAAPTLEETELFLKSPDLSQLDSPKERALVFRFPRFNYYELQKLFFNVIDESTHHLLLDSKGDVVKSKNGAPVRGVPGFDYVHLCKRALKMDNYVFISSETKQNIAHTIWSIEDRRNIPDAISLLNDHDQNIRLLAIDFLQKVVNHLPPNPSLDMLKMHEQEDIKIWKEWWPVNFGNYWESLSDEEKALDRGELPKCVLSSIPDLGMITMVGTLCGPRSPRASWPIEFPPALKKHEIKKTTFSIVFKASPNGEVLPDSVKIKKTSGSSLLDSSVMANIKEYIFRPANPAFGNESGEVEVTIDPFKFSHLPKKRLSRVPEDPGMHLPSNQSAPTQQPTSSALTNGLGPGSSGNMKIQVSNDEGSAVPLEKVIVKFIDGPKFLHVPISQGPVESIAVGETSTFVFPYTIDLAAPYGNYTAKFTVIPKGTPNSVSPDGSMDVLFPFIIDAPQLSLLCGSKNVPNGGRTSCGANLVLTAKDRLSTIRNVAVLGPSSSTSTASGHEFTLPLSNLLNGKYTITATNSFDIVSTHTFTLNNVPVR